MPPSGLEKISDYLWELPMSFKPGMRVPARIYGTERLVAEMDDGVFEQIGNVAMLPGIVEHAVCMPDGHWGYGFPIGGVAATDAESGVVSPGGIGFDINCGMRLLLTGLTVDEVKPHLRRLVDKLFARVPCGVGSRGFISVSHDEFRNILEQGSRWCIRNGYGWDEDLDRTEENGCFAGADAAKVSDRAIERGFRQIGTLGSGNHYLEIQVAHAANIFNKTLAAAFGLVTPDQVVIMFHCGSRGFGHQVATDYLQRFLGVMGPKYSLAMPDRELACAPFASPDGQDYFAAMKCAVNMSFANRQVIAHRIREVFSEEFKKDPLDLGLRQLYDVAHNTAKIETHTVRGKPRSLIVHRKGSTRAFGPGMEGVPPAFKAVGQPVIIGGSMETGSYLLAGVKEGGASFFSTAHGSGRTMSRTRARHEFNGHDIQKKMLEKGIYARTASYPGFAEEAGAAYKDIDEVVRAVSGAGLSVPVARFLPVGNVKG
jgi:tRNA-splicing ligase RtcB